MGLLDLIMGRKRREKRVSAHFRVTIGQSEEHYWTEDVAIGGIRIHLGKQLSLSDFHGGSREIPLEIELDTGPIIVYGEPIWTMRMEDGQLSSGWLFSRFDDDGRERLKAFIDSEK